MAIGVTNFPTALDDNTTLVLASNAATTTLNGALNNSATSITVVSTSLFPSSGVILIDTELISYTGKNSTQFTGCTRAFEATVAASHNSGANVNFVYTAKMRQVLIDAIVAIQTKLGTGVDTATEDEVLIGSGTGTTEFRALTKSDVGLGNVDNTSDSTKNAATAALTNKTIDGDLNTLVDLPANSVFKSGTRVPVGNLGTGTPDGTKFLRDDGAFVSPSGSGDMVLAGVQTVTGAKTFNAGKLLIEGLTSAPAVSARGFYFNTTEGKLYVGKTDGSAWAEIFLAGISGPISVANGGTGAATLTGLLKGNGTSPFTAAVSGTDYVIPSLVLNVESATTYTLQASDNGKTITLNNASPITVTVPSSLSLGFNCSLIQRGAGQVTIVAGSGMTLRNRQSHSKIAGQHGVAAIMCHAAAEFILAGDTST